ncbi:MAG: CFI-box-CTERM domain-containing protein [archaeon]
MEPFLLLVGFTILFVGALVLSGQFSKRVPARRTLRRLFLISSTLLLVALLIPRPAAAVLIVERSLSSSPLRGPFGIDVATNGSFVVFGEKHVGKIGFMGTGLTTLNGLYNFTYSEFSLPGADGSTAEPRDVELGNFSLRTTSPGLRENFVWFTEFVRNRIGVLNLTDGKVVEWQIPTANSGPMNLALDPYNGSIWFTEYSGNKIGRLYSIGNPHTPGAWKFVEYPLPFTDSYPTDIAVDTEFFRGVDSGGVYGIQTYVWFTEQSANKIGRLNSLTGEIVEFETRGTPWGITVTPESFVWFTQKLGDRLGRLDPWVPYVKEVPLPVHSPGNEPLYLKNDSDRAIWFTESVDNRIGKYIPGTNVIQEWIVPTSSSKPHGIAITPRLYGPGVNPIYVGKIAVFFTEEVGNKIGMIIEPFGPGTTTTVGYISSASTSTTSPATITTTVSYTSTSTVTTTFSSTSNALRFVLTESTRSTTITDTTSILVTSTTSTWTKTATSTVVTTGTSTSTSTTTSSPTSVTVTSTTSTSTNTLTSHSTTTTTTSTTSTSTSYSPTISTVTTVPVSSTAISTTTTTTTSTGSFTSWVGSTTTTTTTAAVTVIPTTPSRPCIIASAAYGSELAPEAQYLREFRDNQIVASMAGSQFMKAFNAFYYSFSPAVAETVASQPVLKEVVRAAIYPLIGSLKAASIVPQYLSLDAESSAILSGILASVLIGLIYASPILVIMKLSRGRKR